MKKLIIVLCVLSLLILVACSEQPKPQACTQDAKVCPDGSSVGRTGPNCEFAPCPEVKIPQPPPETIYPEVIVANPAIESNMISIAKIVSAEPGWITIHADHDGQPGDVAGYASVKKGENSNINVELNPKRITPTIYAMLHVDKGQPGVYEFPGPDVPTQENGQVVMVGFTVDIPQPVREKKFTITADDHMFDPSSISVKKGDKVKLTFSFNDPEIYYGGLDVKSEYFTITYRKSDNEESKMVEFTADDSFTFTSYWPATNAIKATGKVDVQ